MSLEKLKLDNGLTIYNDRIASAGTNDVTMFVPYGSVDEKLGDEGVAHVFEHCVHLRTDEFPDRAALRQHAKLNGMVTNANTYYTRTLYYANGLGLEPNIRHLSQILQHTQFPEDKVEHEMKAVRREAITRLDNAGFEHTVAADYAMHGLPYGRNVIGYHDKLDFDAATLKQLHRRYYKLGRMSLIVSGKAKLDDVAELATSYFEADDEEYDVANDAVLDTKLGEHRLTGLVRDDSYNLRVSVAHPMTPEFRAQYQKNRLIYAIAKMAVSEACFQALRYDKGISYDGGVGFSTYNHPNAWDVGGYVTTDKENIEVAKGVFADIFQRDDKKYSDEDIAGSIATFKYAYSSSINSTEDRVDTHVSRLERYGEPEDVGATRRRLDRVKVDDVRRAINDIVDFTSTAPRYTHLTGKRDAIGEVEKIIERGEIA